MTNLSPAEQAVLDAMADLSPAARAVWEAAMNTPDYMPYEYDIAAALRAAADLERQSPWPTSIEGCGARWMRDQLRAIAAELEGVTSQ